jgi:o-succinylbenzoate synthase
MTVKINRIELYRVAMPLVYPFRTAFGNDETIESVLVRLCAGDVYGWGESASWRNPAYSPECAATQFLISKQFIAPLLLNQEVESGQQLQQLLSAIKGNPFAKAAFDLAWWDLYARSLDHPLWKVLGGTSPTIDVGADFGVMESVDRLLDAIDAANQQGYKRVKLKFRPGWELPMIEAVRKRFPSTVFHVDCNSAYTLDDLEMLKQLDRYDLAMIEQPLMHDDLIDHAALQAQIRTPICLDESITSPAKARKAIQIEACRWINIKPGRVGGITNAVAIHNLCQDAGIPCWVGGMLESAVGAAHCLALATLPNIRYPSDIFPSDRFYRQDLSEPAMQHSAPGQFLASTKPGAGTEPNPGALQRMTVEYAAFTA